MTLADAQQLRNVAFISHSGAGKTSIIETLLHATGGITRLGKVEEGNTTSDYEPEEIKRHASIQTAVLPCTWQSHKLNLLDTPGFPDFIGEVISALRAVDASIIVVAAQAGVEVGTEDVWGLCEPQRIPRMVFVNKMDREHADFNSALENLQQVFGRQCVAIQVPIGAQQGFKGVVSLVQPPEDIPAEIAEEVNRLRDRLVEAVAERDDDLATRYLEGKDIPQDMLVASLKQGVLSGDIVPVLAGSATMSLGLNELMSAIVDFLPSPADMPDADAVGGSGGDHIKLDSDTSGPLAAFVFKTTADPFVGKLSYFRVLSGTMKSDSHVWNGSKSQDERVGQLFIPQGKTQQSVDKVGAGDIGAVAKLSATGTGDTMNQQGNVLLLGSLDFPNPIFTYAIYPKSKADLDKMTSSLTRLVEEDPTLRLSRDANTGETLISGIGETHIAVTVDKAKRKFGIDLLASLPKVAYQETISVTTKTEYKHKKQSGGHGQYGHVMIELAPLPRGAGFEFGQQVVGGNVPREYIPSVEKGVVKSLQEGAVANYPIVDLKVVLYDGSSHPVDSSGMSFEIAGSYALRKGVGLASPVLLEPVMKLSVAVPDAYTGEVTGDLNSKRARILGMVPEGGVTVIEAEAPQAEMLRYATELRSMTQGRGRFTLEFTHYQEVPKHLEPRIVEEAKSRSAAAT